MARLAYRLVHCGNSLPLETIIERRHQLQPPPQRATPGAQQPPEPAVPIKLLKLVAQCFERDPRRRPAAAEAVKALLLAREALGEPLALPQLQTQTQAAPVPVRMPMPAPARASLGLAAPASVDYTAAGAGIDAGMVAAARITAAAAAEEEDEEDEEELLSRASSGYATAATAATLESTPYATAVATTAVRLRN